MTATLLAISIGILLYNPALFKGPLENYLSQLSGYSISLDGELVISTGRETVLTVTNLHVANPGWAGDGGLITVGSLSLVLDSRSLFESIVIIESLQIDDLIINSETNTEGVGNWAITPSPQPTRPPQPAEDTNGRTVLIKDIKLNSATIRYLNGKTGVTQELLIVSLDQQQKADGMLDIKLDGILNGRLVEYAGSIGPFANLVAGRDIDFSGNGHFGSLNISGNGSIGDLLKPRQPKFNIDLQGSDIDEITAMLGVNDLGTGRFSLRARGGPVDGRYEAGINGTIGDISLRASAQASDLSGLDDVDLKLAAKGPSLGALTRAFGIKNWPDKPFDLRGEARRVGTTLNISNLNLVVGGTQIMLDALLTNFPAFDTSRVRLSLQGDDIAEFQELLGISGIATGPFEIIGKLDVSADETELVQLELKTSLGQARLAGTLGLGPSYLGTKLHVNLQGPDAHLLLSAAGIDALPQKPFSLNTRIELLPGPFKAAGQVALSNDTLSIKGFSFETIKAQGEIDLETDWPFSKSNDINFDVSVRGDDVSHFFPRTKTFEPAILAYNIEAAGQRMGDLISLRNFAATIGNLNISLQGDVDSVPDDKKVDITFSASSEDISTLGRLNGEPLPAMALDLRTDFSGNANQFTLRNLTGVLGESHLAGTLDVSLRVKKPVITLVATSTYVDIRPFQALLNSAQGTAPAENQDRLIPATPLPLDVLTIADITLILNIDELRYQQDSLRNLDLEAVLQAGELQIKQLDFEGPRGKIRSSLSIIPTDTDEADVQIDLSAEKFVFNLTGQAPEKLAQVPVFDIEVHAGGKGRNMQELAGSLNGSLLLGSEGGILEGVNLSILDTFILDEIFGLIMPKTETANDLNLSCAATIVKISNGKLETAPAFAFTTDQIILDANGSLDLKTEEMRFNFTATPRNALKISASELFNPFIVVGGTLSNPTVGLDPAKVLLRGGAAIGTAGISLLAKGLLDRLGNAAPVCEEMLKEIQQQ